MNEEVLVIVGITAVIVAVILIVAGAVVLARRRRRRTELENRYGPEYDHAVAAQGTRRAVDDLSARERERGDFTPAALDEAQKEGLRRRLAVLQFRFVDDPSDVLLETQRVVVDALRAMGYPVAEDRERALRLLSVDHAGATGALRTLLSGSYGKDVGRMQALFAETKVALRDVARLTYSPGDLEAPGVVGGPEAMPAPPASTSRDGR